MSGHRRLPLVAILVIIAAACSSSPKDGAEGIIEGELADLIGLGALTATCEDPG